ARQEARKRAVHLQSKHHRLPAGLSGRPIESGLAQSKLRQRFVRACRYSVTSGRTATGQPTASTSGRSEWLSAYPYEADRSTSLSRAQFRIQDARASPVKGDEARKPVHTPVSSTARSAASMWSNSGASGRVSGRIAPVMSTVR